MKKYNIVLGSDHAGFDAKEHIKKFLNRIGYKYEDIGTFGRGKVDYPDYAKKIGLAVRKDGNKRGIIVCATGIGATIAANKIPGIRAANVRDAREAKL